jgi:prephenate dehydratase
MHSQIESRPQRKRPLRIVDDSNNGTAKYFDYLFYIDFEASMADSRAQNALGHLQVQQVIYICVFFLTNLFFKSNFHNPNS